MERIGNGYFGEVWRTYDTARGCVCAMKVVKIEFFMSFKARTDSTLNIDTEYNMMNALDHPLICKAYDFTASNGYSRMHMEFVRGETWFERLMAAGPFDTGVTARLASQASSAVAHMHDRNIMHRDIKPENIMVVDSAGTYSVKFIDFGLARETPFQNCTIVGSSYHCAPEVLFPSLRPLSGVYGNSADIWSLGVTFYEAWCASPPVDEITWRPSTYPTSYEFLFDEPQWQGEAGTLAGMLIRDMTAWVPSHRSRADQWSIRWTMLTPP